MDAAIKNLIEAAKKAAEEIQHTIDHGCFSYGSNRGPKDLVMRLRGAIELAEGATYSVRCPNCKEEYEHLASEPLLCGHCGVGDLEIVGE